MINTKYNYYKTVKWLDIYIYKHYNKTRVVISYKNNKLNRLTDKVIMRKLVKLFRKHNKLANELQLISSKEQYYY